MSAKSKDSLLLLLPAAVLVLLFAAFLMPRYEGNLFSKSTLEAPEFGELRVKYPELDLLTERILQVNEDISLEDLKKEKTKKIEIDNERYNYEEIDGENVKWVFSPKQKYALSIYTYIQEPDSSLEIYRGGAKIERFWFCGTPCAAFGVLWLDDSKFVFVWDYFGFAEPENEGRDVFNLHIDVYDLESEVIYPYIFQGLKDAPSRPRWEDWDRRIKEINEDLRGS